VSLGHPSKFQWVSRFGFVTAPTQWRSTKLCTMFGCLLSWYIIYIHFSGLLPPDRIFPGAKFTLHPSLALSYRPIGSITWAVGVSRTLRHGTRNAIKELSQRVPPVFSRAAITLGIGPHSSSVLFLSLLM